MMIFVIYRFDESREMKWFITQVVKNSRSDIKYSYLKDDSNDRKWRRCAEKGIKASDAVIVLEARTTQKTSNQNWEINRAILLDKEIYTVSPTEYGKIVDQDTDPLLYKWIEAKYSFSDELAAIPVSADEKVLIEQYKIMIQSSETLIQRRQATNTFYVTLTGGVIASIGFVLKELHTNLAANVTIQILCLVGCVLCVSWHNMLVNFGKLNSGKFAAINKLETALKSKLFEIEWVALGKGLRPRIYQSFTKTESRIPIYFSIGYMITSTFFAYLGATGNVNQ